MGKYLSCCIPLLVVMALAQTCTPKRSPVDMDKVKMVHRSGDKNFRRRAWWQMNKAREENEKSYRENQSKGIPKPENQEAKKGKTKMMFRPIWKKNVRIGEYKTLYKAPTYKTRLQLFGQKDDPMVEELRPREWFNRKILGYGRYASSKKTKQRKRRSKIN